jgi:FAD/FMN-containing dehydrogenase
VAENAGGAHCLKYGVTTNHVLGLTLVTWDGDIVHLGGKALDTPGYDLVGLLVGSEGTMGIVTEVTVRLLRRPQSFKTVMAVFDSEPGRPSRRHRAASFPARSRSWTGRRSLRWRGLLRWVSGGQEAVLLIDGMASAPA